MADVEHNPDVPPQGAMRLRNRDRRQLREPCRRGAGVEVAGEIRDGFVGRLQKAVRFRLDGQRDGPPGARFDLNEVRGDPQHVLGVAGDHVRAGDVGLETERRRLDRRRDVCRRDVGKDVGDVDRVLGSLFGPPVGLVDLLLDDRVLECPIRKGVDGVDVEVVVGEKSLELRSLGPAFRENGCRGRGQPDADSEGRVGRDAGLDLRQIGCEARPQLLPRIRRVHERRVREMAETVAEIHSVSPPRPHRRRHDAAMYLPCALCIVHADSATARPRRCTGRASRRAGALRSGKGWLSAT